MTMNVEVYRVNWDKPWYRRTWQAEWEGCYWTHRGYTRRGLMAGVEFRMSHPRANAVYVRGRIITRRLITQRAWYKRKYDALGRARSMRASGRG